ncbi:xylulokinase [Mycobacterium decipiens]|uniref:Carbohydrate kinase n=1 Tax=Mycobacterium decipiens TaxID=1430326 RepID=A0A1X2LPX5_9MYCO|nr:FGGY family carbohydrate kinase [Mycobacterium decipiens]OSC38148.1 hypothetical protein B8W66_20640 [Mycobacterium decipiens]
MPELIALDIGTTGTKAALVSRDGRILASGYSAYASHNQAGNRVEQEPDAWWLATSEAIAQLRTRLSMHAHELAGIALSGQMQDLIPIAADDAIGPAVLYSDTRSQREAQMIIAQIGEEELLRVTGNAQDASSLLAKWCWLQAHDAERLAAAQTILFGAHSYVAWRLCGATSCDYTTASTTGLFDLDHNVWATDLLARLGLDPQKLPPLAAAAAQIGTLKTAAARALGLPADLAVFAGAGDLAATTVGAGAGEPNRSYGYLGMSGWVAATLRATVRAVPPGAERSIFTLRHPDLQRVVRVAPMLTAGGNLDWVRAEIARDEDYGALNEIAAAAPVGSNGMIYLPYLNGERSPFRDPHARACFVGIGGRTTRADLIRAVMEGVCFAYRSLFDGLETMAETLYVVGGGAKSDVWMQILADVLGRELQVVAEPEHAAVRGAAIIVGREMGWYEDFAPRDIIPVARSYAPRDRAHSAYEEQYGVFVALYPRLRSAFAQLAAAPAVLDPSRS